MDRSSFTEIKVTSGGSGYSSKPVVLIDWPPFAPELRAEVIIYGPRRGYRNEVPARMKAFGGYLRHERGVAPEKVAIRAGGFRERAAMEIWLLEPDSCPVAATPTVLTREVVYIRGRFVVVRV